MREEAERNREAEIRQTKSNEVLKEISESKSRGEAMMQALYRKLVSLMILNSGLGVSTDTSVERETAQALMSVFPRTELKPFLDLDEAAKAAKVTELSDIVMGIRLFNRATGKGGRDIEDSPVLAHSEAEQLGGELSREAAQMSQTVDAYADVINYLKNSSSGSGRIAQLKNELANRRQYLSYVQRMSERVSTMTSTIGRLRTKHDRELAELKTLIGTKQSVLKDQVYPKFMIIANLWTALCEQLVQVQTMRRLFGLLLERSEQFIITMTSDDRDNALAFKEGRETSAEADAAARQRALEEAQAEADRERMARTSADKPIRLFYQATPDFLQQPIAYKGFCPVTIVERDGLLLPGDSSLGLVRHGGANYALVDEDAVSAFMRDPVRFVDGVVEACKREPHLIYLLGLSEHSAFPGFSRPDYGAKLLPSVHRLLHVHPTKCDAGEQTPTHFVESYIDPKYNWNEWSMRRQALKLANLKTKRTHSMQTDNSHFRRDAESQHYEQRQGTTQTTTNSSSNVPKTFNYMQGLRGHPHQPMQTVSLTVDLQEHGRVK